MKLLTIIFCFILLTSCTKDSESSQMHGSGFEVEKLFTHDGCTVYRFEDAMRLHYFTTCKGSVGSYRTCGKNCTEQESIETSIN